MMRLVPIATALLLGLVLAMTSVSMAVARGGMSLSGSMVLCIDATQQVVPLGPDGSPQDTRHACPDCTMGAMALTGALPLDRLVLRAARLHVRPVVLIVHATPVQGGQGRGPPS
ncbi:MAG: hypothetical protein R6U99_08815 [Nioella sp.]